jgi:hypothetical protein
LLQPLRYRIYNLNYSMAKLYTKETVATTKMAPKKETIDFLLTYSKALSVVKIGNAKFEIIAN